MVCIKERNIQGGIATAQTEAINTAWLANDVLRGQRAWLHV